MTPKEKAKELYIKYRGFNDNCESETHISAKQCAIIAVDEIVSIVRINVGMLAYWQTVKDEINKI